MDRFTWVEEHTKKKYHYVHWLWRLLMKVPR